MNYRSNHDELSGGFPHSDIHGSKPIPGSPWLNAGYHVLHRLLLPRHPPNALFALDPIQEKQDAFPVGSILPTSCWFTGCLVSVLDLTVSSLGSNPGCSRYSGAPDDTDVFLSTMSIVVRLDDQAHPQMRLMIEPGKGEWWVKMDSNHRPYAYQAYALTT